MKKIRFTEEQITYALRQVEGGTPPADVCRQMGCSEASFYIWKKRYGSMGMTELEELRDENARLKRLVSDARQEHPFGARALDPHAVPDRRNSIVSAGRVVQDGAVACAGP